MRNGSSFRHYAKENCIVKHIDTGKVYWIETSPKQKPYQLKSKRSKTSFGEVFEIRVISNMKLFSIMYIVNQRLLVREVK